MKVSSKDHPRGLQWQWGSQAQEQSALIDTLDCLYRSHGFLPMETPILTRRSNALLETTEANDIFVLRDKEQKTLELRYDMTSALVDFVHRYYQDLPKPLKRYQSGFVFRDEKPSTGRFRQFLQSDVDCIGRADIHADAEMCLLMDSALAKIGLSEEERIIRIGHRGILDGILDTLDIHDQHKRLTILRVIDKKDRLSQEDLLNLLGDGRKDPSGDFTAGVKLSAGHIRALEPLVFTTSKTLQDIEKLIALSAPASSCAQKAFEDCEKVFMFFQAIGKQHAFLFDLSVVRGLAYYTGLVFEASLVPQKKISSSRQKTSLSIGGGGRYDHLITSPAGETIPSTGFSLGVSRIHAWMMEQKRSFLLPQPMMIIVSLDGGTPAHDFQLAQELRSKGYIVEVAPYTLALKKQLRYADKRHFHIALIMGERERQDKTITVKNLVQGRKESLYIKQREQWLKHPAQKTIPLGDLSSYLEKTIPQCL